MKKALVGFAFLFTFTTGTYSTEARHSHSEAWLEPKIVQVCRIHRYVQWLREECMPSPATISLGAFQRPIRDFAFPSLDPRTDNHFRNIGSSTFPTDLQLSQVVVIVELLLI